LYIVTLSDPIKLGPQFNEKVKIKDTYIDVERDDEIQSKTNKMLYIKQFRDNPIRKSVAESSRITQAQLHEKSGKNDIT
jgi:hypothetical protein